MVATFNGWDDMREAEREALERWEQQQRPSAAWAQPTWWIATAAATSSDRLMPDYPSAR